MPGSAILCQKMMQRLTLMQRLTVMDRDVGRKKEKLFSIFLPEDQLLAANTCYLEFLFPLLCFALSSLKA